MYDIPILLEGLLDFVERFVWLQLERSAGFSIGDLDLRTLLLQRVEPVEISGRLAAECMTLDGQRAADVRDDAQHLAGPLARVRRVAAYDVPVFQQYLA